MSPRLPSLKPREVIRALERAGFFVARTSASHCLLKHREKPGHNLTVSHHTKDIRRDTLASIIKQAGMTREEFLGSL